MIYPPCPRTLWQETVRHLSNAVLSNQLFKDRGPLGFQNTFVAGPTSIEGIHCIDLVQSVSSKICVNLMLHIPLENLILIVGEIYILQFML